MLDGSLTAIAAVADNGVIGADGDVPWHIREDWARFKAVTMGGVLVLGRATHESIGRLPGRERVVITRDRHYDAGRWPVATSVDEAMEVLAERYLGKRWWCAGGGHIYRMFWPVTTNLDLTWVHQSPPGDTTFPVVSPEIWAETARTARDGYTFSSYSRRPS